MTNVKLRWASGDGGTGRGVRAAADDDDGANHESMFFGAYGDRDGSPRLGGHIECNWLKSYFVQSGHSMDDYIGCTWRSMTKNIEPIWGDAYAGAATTRRRSDVNNTG